MATEHEVGVLVGLLIGEGHFGGDSRQPQITLRMHVRHAAMFRWLERTFPGGRLYGPYDHGGRRYYQWMVRGAYLRELVSLLGGLVTPELDEYAYERFEQMLRRYPAQLGTPSNAASEGEPDPATPDPATPDPATRPSIFSELHEKEES